MYMYHIFFVHSFVNEYLSCFSVLIIANSAVINIEVHVTFQTVCRFLRKLKIDLLYDPAILLLDTHYRKL